MVGNVHAMQLDRCDICGDTVDPSDGDHMTVIEDPHVDSIDAEGITQEEVAEAMAEALRHTGEPEDYSAAEAYEKKGGLVAHQDCFQKTSIPSIHRQETDTTGGDDGTP